MRGCQPGPAFQQGKLSAVGILKTLTIQSWLCGGVLYGAGSMRDLGRGLYLIEIVHEASCARARARYRVQCLSAKACLLLPCG